MRDYIGLKITAISILKINISQFNGLAGLQCIQATRFKKMFLRHCHVLSIKFLHKEDGKGLLIYFAR